MKESTVLWHENQQGQLVKCPAKIKCRLGGEHFPGVTREEADAHRELKLQKDFNLTSQVTNDSEVLEARLANADREALLKSIDDGFPIPDNLPSYTKFNGISKQELLKFTRGNCLIFAQELQKVLDENGEYGEIVVAGEDPDNNWEGSTAWSHAALRLSDGRILDATGSYSQEEDFRHFSEATLNHMFGEALDGGQSNFRIFEINGYNEKIYGQNPEDWHRDDYNGRTDDGKLTRSEARELASKLVEEFDLVQPLEPWETEEQTFTVDDARTMIFEEYGYSLDGDHLLSGDVLSYPTHEDVDEFDAMDFTAEDLIPFDKYEASRKLFQEFSEEEYEAIAERKNISAREVNGVIATQDSCQADSVAAYMAHPDERSYAAGHEGDDLPVLFRFKENLYCIDGHHRLSAAAIMGRNVDVKIIPIDGLVEEREGNPEDWL